MLGGGRRVNLYNKKQSTAELIRRRRLFDFSDVPQGMPAQLKEIRDRHLLKLKALMAELYCEHFTDEQLQALLAFYQSDTGRAILQEESEIAEQSKERLRQIGMEMNAEASKVSGGMLSSCAAESSRKPGDQTVTRGP
jgi:hypothetical protein